MADRRLAAGLRLAVTTLTVAPLRPGRVDRATAAIAMRAAPAVGLVLGALTGMLGRTTSWLGAPPLLAGALTVGAGVMLTRGLHIDGLADTVDALGSHRTADQALDIMKKPDVGAFGATAITLTLLIQAAAASVVLARSWPEAVAGVAAATATGRVAIAAACRRGIPAARPDGLGALVAGTVGPVATMVGAIVVAGMAVLAVPGRAWQGPLGVIGALALAAGLTHHCVRRLRGVTGDVLGAACEVAVTSAYVVLAISR